MEEGAIDSKRQKERQRSPERDVETYAQKDRVSGIHTDFKNQ